MSKEDLVLLDTTLDGVATVTLNQPDVHNAFSAEVIERLDDIFEDLQGADGVHVVVLRGKGKSFSAGANLNWMKAAADQEQWADTCQRWLIGRRSWSKRIWISGKPSSTVDFTSA